MIQVTTFPRNLFKSSVGLCLIIISQCTDPLAFGFGSNSLSFDSVIRSEHYPTSLRSFRKRFLELEASHSSSCSSSEQEESFTSNEQVLVSGRKTLVDRGTFLASAALGVASAVVSPTTSFAATEKFTTYEDKDCNFKIDVPSSWEQSLQKLPDRRKLVLFVDPSSSEAKESDKTIMFIAYTPVRDDFTSLGSFGSVEQVGQMTILPKGSLVSGTDDQSEMIKAESKKNAYFFDYTVQPAGQTKMHHRAIFMLSPTGTGGAGAVLVTVNVQTPEDSYKDGNLSSVFDTMMDSFGKAI